MDNNDNQSNGGLTPGGVGKSIDGFRNVPQNVNNQAVNQPSAGAAATQPQVVPEPQSQVVPESSERPDFVSDRPIGEEPKKSHKGFLIVLIVIVALGILGVLAVFLFTTVFVDNKIGGDNPEPKPIVEPEPKQIANPRGDFEYSFLKMEAGEKNLIYSPLSIKYALNLLNEGAVGETKEQIDAVLNGAELTKYDNVESKLSLANAVFIKNDFKDSVKEEYINSVLEKYNADVLYDEFTDVRAIDSWIDNKTFGLIKDSGVKVAPETEMVLANALAIQLDWLLSFDAESTRGREFSYKDGKDEATTMSKSFSGKDARLYDDGEVSAVAMDLEPVGSTELEFVAIMPEEDLSKFIDKTDEKIENILDGLVAVEDYDEIVSDSSQDVKAFSKLDYLSVYIPKFKFDYELKGFKEELQALGIKNAFSSEADFSEMADTPLRVSQAIHKANIDFSEDGIKAAAITIFVMDGVSALEDPDPYQPVVKTITFDKPFMFIIRDKNTGEKWFVGTVYEPNKWADDKEEYIEK